MKILVAGSGLVPCRDLRSVYKGKVEFIDRKLNFSSSFPHGEDMYFLTKSGDVYRRVNGSKK